jgi:hypothetical protein
MLASPVAAHADELAFPREGDPHQGVARPIRELLRLCVCELILWSSETTCSSFFELRRALA